MALAGNWVIAHDAATPLIPQQYPGNGHNRLVCSFYSVYCRTGVFHCSCSCLLAQPPLVVYDDFVAPE